MHFCNDLSRIFFRYEKDRCYFVPDTGEQEIPIKFCPWCGASLENKVENGNRAEDILAVCRVDLLYADKKDIVKSFEEDLMVFLVRHGVRPTKVKANHISTSENKIKIEINFDW